MKRMLKGDVFMKQRTYLQISENMKYVNVGVEYDDDILFFQINFINNIQNWGIVVINPDGIVIANVKPYEENINMQFDFEGKRFQILVVSPHNGMYEVNFMEV